MPKRIGPDLQARIDRLELAASARPWGAIALGIATALAVMLGGVAVFALVFLFLVGVVR